MITREYVENYIKTVDEKPDDWIHVSGGVTIGWDGKPSGSYTTGAIFKHSVIPNFFMKRTEHMANFEVFGYMHGVKETVCFVKNGQVV